MECHRKLATEAKELAEEKIGSGGHDVSGAMKLAVKARRLYPELKGIDQLISVLDVLLAAADNPKDYRRKRKDYYRILQVDPHAEENVIKKQYRKIALNVHPDKNPSVGAEEAFKLVIEAFEVLSDERKRAMYDQGVLHGLSNIRAGRMAEWQRKREEWQKNMEELQRKKEEWQREREDSQKETEECKRKWEEWLKKMEALQKKRPQSSDEDLYTARMKMQKNKEEWENRRSQMSEEDMRKTTEEWKEKLAGISRGPPEIRDENAN